MIVAIAANSLNALFQENTARILGQLRGGKVPIGAPQKRLPPPEECTGLVLAQKLTIFVPLRES